MPGSGEIGRDVLMPVGRDDGPHARDLPLANLRSAKPARRKRWFRRVATLLTVAPFALFFVTLTFALVYSLLNPPSTLMLRRWLTGQGVTQDPVPLSAVSPSLVQAVIAAEDQRFCLHRGVDWGALRDVVEDEEGPSRGASTVTMQTVKNVFLWPDRSYIRKGLEIPFALLADAVWGKRRTLEIYLNVAEWGDGIFGVEAASRHWFHKSAKDLTRGEAALLAAILPNPILRSASKPSRGVKKRAGMIQARMNGVGGLLECVRG